MRKFWAFAAEGAGRALRLEGPISDEAWWGDEVTPAAFRADLYAGQGDIVVWINSPGGSVFAAAEIYTMLKEYPGKVTVKIDGFAASAASVIAMAGNEILMSPVSYMVIHNPATMAFGDSAEMQRTGAMLDEIKEGIINAYALKTGLPRERLSELMNEESCFSARRAVELGFADGILYTVTNSFSIKGGAFTMGTITDLQQQRAATWEKAKAFLDAKGGADKRLNAEDAAVYDAMEAEVTALGKDIERLERAANTEHALDAMEKLRLEQPGETPKTGRASDGYKKDFWNALRGRQFSNSLKIGSDPDGGYLVPDEFERRLIEALEEQNIFRRLATVIQTGSGERQIPIVATKGTAAWVEEEALIPESGDTFGQVTLGAYKVATMIKISTELLNDSAFNMEAYIAREFARRIGIKEEEAFFTGDGSKKPTGVLTSATVGKTAAAATTITFDDLIDLFYALREPYRARADFIANEDTVKTIRKLKDNNGQYIWQPAVQAGQPDRILGRPIYTSSFMPTMAAGANAVAFGDFSYYWIADRQNRTFQRLNELFATTGQVGFIATQRVDGKLILPEAVQVLQMGAA